MKHLCNKKAPLRKRRSLNFSGLAGLEEVHTKHNPRAGGFRLSRKGIVTQIRALVTDKVN
jgi:hypothetical protein